MRNTDFRINTHESTPVQRYLKSVFPRGRQNTVFRINPHESPPVQRYLSIISVESSPFYREALPIPITSVEAPCDLGPIEISSGCGPSGARGSCRRTVDPG